MSKQNKANKNNYMQGGRLSPDDMARERKNQETVGGRARGKENVIGKTRPSGERGSIPRRSGRGE